MILFHVEVPIFKTAVVFAGDCTAEEANNGFYDYEGHRSKIEFNSKDLGSVCMYNGDVYMWVKDCEYGSTMLHEMVHVAFSICESRHMESDQELICYLVGWLKVNLMDRIYEMREEREGDGSE